ncbi:DEAD/DEAH box helicase [Tahibacter amnicola]|uniref:DEAD/DEAH box helicase n=1 Tax=Tahibacter amnicola TaxID=2976241 RepID=A0ABY6BEU7_9GAMM|nr:DEAD/DEAH box helicase [Tahibacter amnicola]UXI68553.1 DEAD/DEAH box helicase [Tahibacter amnicola]
MDRSQFAQLLGSFDLTDYLDEHIIERGLDYVARGRVLSATYHAGKAQGRITCQVQGSGKQPYTTSIALRESGEGVEVINACTCPMQGDCKHVAAVALQVVGLYAVIGGNGDPGEDLFAPATPRDPDLHQWDYWLSSLNLPADTPPGATEPRVLGFLFEAGAGTPQRLCAQAVWFRHGKRGGLVSPRPVQPAPGSHDPWGSLTPDEFLRIAELRMAPSDMARLQGWHCLGSPRHEAWLLDVLANAPCYFGKPGSSALRLGASRGVDWRWLNQTDGTQRLEPRVAGTADNTVILKIAGLWYWDGESGEIGRVEGDLRLAERLLAAPQLQPEQVAVLRTRWKANETLAAVPLPEDPGPIEVVKVSPVPVLRMATLQAGALGRSARGSYVAGCLHLSFDYAGERFDVVPALRNERRRAPDRIREFVRDRGAELAAAERLDRHKLVEAIDVAYAHGVQPRTIQPGDYVLERGRSELAPPEQLLALALRLQADGFQLEFDAESPVEILPAPEAWHADIDDTGNAWFDLSLGIDISGHRVDLLPILQKALGDPSFPLKPPAKEAEDAVWLAPVDARRRVPLPVARVRALIAPLLEWLEAGAVQESLQLRRAQVGVVEELTRGPAALPWRGGTRLKDTLARIGAERKPVTEPPGFRATLRPYQRDGLAWLEFLGSAGLGGILADDMGLGKTVQVLAHLEAMRQRGELADPALVIAPTSLVWNWRAEAQRFAPDLKVLILHGATRDANFATVPDHDLVITTYPLLSRDRDELINFRFSLLIVDEAQAIKNARTQAAKVVRELDARRRLAMTGTPLENHLGELWAQFDAVEPGLLGDEKSFVRHYRTPIEKHADVERQQKLHKRIAPLMLRRRKEDVLTDLPPKTVIERGVELIGKQRELYESLRLAQHERVREAIRERGLAQSGIVVLDALLKLRQVCCDPRLVKLERARRAPESAKLDLLLDLLRELAMEGRRVLVFSQFAEMLGLIELALDEEGIAYQTLTGQTRDRAELVQRFQTGDVPVFLISLKAGGVGLNLTAADTVIHYDPWWNPAVEAQATDRVHRIGQDKPVFVYKLICNGTVEEKIQDLQQRKAELAQAVLEGGTTQALRFDEEDLAELFGM